MLMAQFLIIMLVCSDCCHTTLRCVIWHIRTWGQKSDINSCGITGDWLWWSIIIKCLDIRDISLLPLTLTPILCLCQSIPSYHIPFRLLQIMKYLYGKFNSTMDIWNFTQCRIPISFLMSLYSLFPCGGNGSKTRWHIPPNFWSYGSTHDLLANINKTT